MAVPFVLLAAGGTGGHLFPAEALAHALIAKGARVALATDTRAAAYAGAFPAEAVYPLAAATPSGRNPLIKVRALLTLAQGTLAARALVRRIQPDIVVGFGGYPTVPPVLGASLSGVKTLIHEQNAVIGRANRFLAGRATGLATGFANVGGTAAFTTKMTHVGNPVRPAVIAAAATPWQAQQGGQPLRVLVFGGSQGARIMADIVPAAMATLGAVDRARITVAQQVRAEDMGRVQRAYDELGVACDLAPFFADLPQRMAQSHLVIARSGASTVAELGVIGRPSILVPLPGSLDQDQAANAKSLQDAGAALRIMQSDFAPQRLAHELEALLAAPERLTGMAEAAKSAGIPDAAERLAGLVLRLAR
jgi:UDP-N-acetylglucosamine--N-acetylmuramyl-(pentapeptide) pyrophosphoryl-undecaprenol N-acetylglucosamine transferase